MGLERLFTSYLKSRGFFLGFQAYDVTRFLEEHPGGDEVLLSATGMCGFISLRKGV
jgi:hypothetical protein